ncbi:tyrosine-protein phosphatase [Flavobacterium sp.]|uniref:tyrosine-protein phosphatase n=1 Tax=Flavobacterium sp. TaxID=239 RepID=UPI003BD80C6E
MIFFNKNKPFLKDLIPNDFIDIHSHLLPGIDDGAKTIEDTLFLINGLKEIGFSEFITTPHIFKNVWDNSRTIIEEKHTVTSSELKNNSITNSFKAAAEYMMDESFYHLIEKENLLVLKENYVLVEMSYLYPPLNLYDIIFNLQVAGYNPVLAHPERYNFYHSNVNEYKKLKKVGCRFQMNILSSTGYYGPEVAKAADYLLKNDMIDFVGSDVHHEKHLSFFDKKIILKNIEPFKEAFQNNSFFKS